jgi:hypothetical protein
MSWVLLIGGFSAVWVWMGREADKADKEAARRPENQHYD